MKAGRRVFQSCYSILASFVSSSKGLTRVSQSLTLKNCLNLSLISFFFKVSAAVPGRGRRQFSKYSLGVIPFKSNEKSLNTQ